MNGQRLSFHCAENPEKSWEMRKEQHAKPEDKMGRSPASNSSSGAIHSLGWLDFCTRGRGQHGSKGRQIRSLGGVWRPPSSSFPGTVWIQNLPRPATAAAKDNRRTSSPKGERARAFRRMRPHIAIFSLFLFLSFSASSSCSSPSLSSIPLLPYSL